MPIPHPCRVLAALGCLLALACPTGAPAQAITTIAGGGAGDGGLAVNAPLAGDLGLAYDTAGNLYIADTGQNRVRRVDAATGIITTVAGNGTFDSNGDGGLATLAAVGQPQGIALDSTGNLYVSDNYGNVVRRVDAATGIITTAAGSGAIGFSGDGGPATSAALFIPLGLAFDDADNLYIADRANLRVRKVTRATGIITTVAAGNGAEYFSSPTAMNSGLGYITSLAWEPGGFLLVMDAGWDLLHRVHLGTGAIGVVAGVVTGRSGLENGWQGTFNGDGAATSRSLNDPFGVARNAAGDWFIADTANNRVRKVSAGVISTIAGNGTAGFAGDGGLATAALLDGPRAIAVDAAGNVAFVDARNRRVRRIDAVTGVITTIAGDGASGSCCDGSPATSASLVNPSGVAVDSAGNLYIADTGGHRVRRVDAATQTITTVAGTGVAGYFGEGLAATAAILDSPAAVAMGPAGDLFIADTGNHRIRRLDLATGLLHTVAGNGLAAFTGDGGSATGASLDSPVGLAFNGAGDLLIADTGNDRVRLVNHATGLIVTIAGNGLGGGDPEEGLIPYSGDGGLPISATLFAPTGIAFDAAARLYIVNRGYSRVHRVEGGFITTIAGNGATFTSGDGGLATDASFKSPYGIAVDGGGNYFISDEGSHRIRRVDAATGVITTFAGTGAAGFDGDGGAPSSASLNTPRGLARNSAGGLLIADAQNGRVRKVSIAPQAPETLITASPPVTTASTSASFSFAGVGGTGVLTVECSLDAGAFAACTSPFDVTALGIGSHTFSVRAVDGGGLQDPTPSSFTWSVSGTAGIFLTSSLFENLSLVVGGTRTFDLVVQSTGNAPLVFGTPWFNGEAAGFSFANGCPASLAPPATCTITVTWTPAAPGPVNVSLIIPSNANPTYPVVFIGEAVAATPGISLPSSRFDNLSLAVGGTWSFDLVVRSTGNVPLVFGTPWFNGDVAGFSLANGCPASLAPSATCTITVAWTPAAPGPVNAALIIPSNANPAYPVVFIGEATDGGTLRVDFDANARSDLVWQHADGRVAVWLMNGLASTATSEILPAGTGFGVAHMADFNGDGKADLLWQHADGRVAVWFMNGTVPSATQQILNAGSGWTAMATPDLDGDGKADIVWQHTDGTIAAWLMNGSAVTSGADIFGAGTGWRVTNTGDFDGDGKGDLVWTDGNGEVLVVLMNGLTPITINLVLNAGTGWSVTHAADLDGDGRTDIVWKHTDGRVSAWLMNGAAMASGSGILGAGTGWSVAHTADFDGDGKEDLLWQHPDGRAAIWLMNGLVPSAMTQILNAGGGWRAKRTGDLDGDGKADIVWEHTDGSVAVWLMNGTVMSSGSSILGPASGWSVSGASP